MVVVVALVALVVVALFALVVVVALVAVDALVGPRPHWLGHTGPKLAIVYWPAARLRCIFSKVLMMIIMITMTAVIILK